MNNIGITKHCYQKLKERCSIKNHKSAQKKVELAFTKGKRFSDYTEDKRQYLLSKEQNLCQAVVYDKFCYIFNQNNACVTVYKLPEWFSKRKKYVGKEMIKNEKRYSRKYQ